MIRSFNGKSPKIDPTAFISEAAYIVGDVEIGAHASVWPHAVIRADGGRIVIGEYSIVEDGCILHSDIQPPGFMSIGNYVNVGHGAVIHGKSIGNNVLIGMNATVLHDSEIGSFCLIAAGSLVSAGMVIPDGSFVVGAPAKIKSKVTESQKYWLTPQGYADIARQYKEQGLGSSGEER